MAWDLRQSTARVVMVGPFVDKGDGFTLEEAITVTNLTESLFKDIGAALPTNLAANGTFDTDTGWTKGTNWRIDFGNNNLADQSSASASVLSQTPATALIEGHAYEVVFTITNRTAGSITCKIGGTSGTARSTNATFTEIIIAGSGSLIEFDADGTWDGELDTVTYELSHIERTPSTGDMVFADGGTYYKLLSVTDTIILGFLSLVYEDVSDILPRREEFQVIPANVFDSLYSTDKLQVDLNQISGDAAAADNLEATYDGTGYVDAKAPATQEGVAGISVGSSAINAVADDDNTDAAIKSITFVGSQTNTFSATAPLDGTRHIIDDTSNEIDIVYGFSIGGDGVPVELIFTGFLSSGNDELNVFGYDFVAAAFVRIGTLDGQGGSNNSVQPFNLTTAMVGLSGADIGKVFVRFQNTGQSNPQLNVDQLLLAFSVVRRTVGYANGAVWIDTTLSNENTEDFVDGTADNPVSTIAAALTIATSIGLTHFHIAAGSSITLAAAFTTQVMDGEQWTLALGGQDVSSSEFIGADATGTGTTPGGEAHFEHCGIGTMTIGQVHFENCSFEGTLTLSAAAGYLFQDCTSEGTPAWILDLGSSVGSQDIDLHHFNGEVDLRNVGQSGTDNVHVFGIGTLLINVNCIGGTIDAHGHWDITDNGTSTVSRDEVFQGVIDIEAIGSHTDL